MAIDKDKRKPTTAAELRRLAEKQLQAKSPEACIPLTDDDARRLLHELQVHQIELEMQNAELLQARDEMERALGNYTDLYDFAPIGYFTLDRDGTVRAVNLTGAKLLEIERSRLIGRRFGQFINAGNRPAFTDFLGKVFTSRDKEACEVELMTEGNTKLFLHFEAVAFGSGQECRVAIIDITERKQAEEQIFKHVEELRVTNDELNRFNRASVERELRMIELKKEINKLCVESGRPPRFPLEFEKGT
jgi:PAS domain S-box-containing protein